MNIYSEVINADVYKALPKYKDKAFDLILVDAPYGIGAPKMRMGSNPVRDKGAGISIAEQIRNEQLNDWHTGSGKLKDRILNTSSLDWDDTPPPADFWQNVFRVSKNQIIFGANYYQLPPTRGVICWDKKQPWTNFSQFELIWTSFNKPARIISISSRGGSNKVKKIHPTQKPVQLYHELLSQFSTPGMNVLDTHLGSGTSRIAAYNLNLNFTGYEKDKNYYIKHLKFFKNEIKVKNN